MRDEVKIFVVSIKQYQVVSHCMTIMWVIQREILFHPRANLFFVKLFMFTTYKKCLPG